MRNRSHCDVPKAEYGDTLNPLFSLQDRYRQFFNPLSTLRLNFLVKIMALLNCKQLPLFSRNEMIPLFVFL